MFVGLFLEISSAAACTATVNHSYGITAIGEEGLKTGSGIKSCSPFIDHLIGARAAVLVQDNRAGV